MAQKVVNVDDSLMDGDVLIRANDSIVSNLVLDRVADLRKQLSELDFTEARRTDPTANEHHQEASNSIEVPQQPSDDQGSISETDDSGSLDEQVVSMSGNQNDVED